MDHQKEKGDTGTHVLIRFKEERNENNQLPVEIAPKFWLGMCRNNQYSVFPPKDKYEEAMDWISSNRLPDAEWEKFPVDIVAYAVK